MSVTLRELLSSIGILDVLGQVTDEELGLEILVDVDSIPDFVNVIDPERIDVEFNHQNKQVILHVV